MTFRVGGAEGLIALAWPYKVHIVLGMTIFLLFPFSRLVHVWSGFATVAYLFRPQQVVRSRRLNVPAGHNQPRSPAPALRSRMHDQSPAIAPAAPINGVALNTPGRSPVRRGIAPARVHRIAAPGGAVRRPAGCGATTRAADGVISEAASRAIEALLERALQLPEPSEDACRRHYAAHAGRLPHRRTRAGRGISCSP